MSRPPVEKSAGGFLDGFFNDFIDEKALIPSTARRAVYRGTRRSWLDTIPLREITRHEQMKHR